MHDQRTGTGGLVSGIIVLFTTAFSIVGLKRSIVLQALISSEVSAKLAMVTEAWVGRSAHEGMNTLFLNSMHSKYRNLRLAAALAISLVIVLPLSGVSGFVAVAIGMIVSLIMVVISGRHFGGLTGDVMGQLTSLLAWVLAVPKNVRSSLRTVLRK
jgi:adenosylcobinamide-GDP ribazoletransferase